MATLRQPIVSLSRAVLRVAILLSVHFPLSKLTKTFPPDSSVARSPDKSVISFSFFFSFFFPPPVRLILIRKKKKKIYIF